MGDLAGHQLGRAHPFGGEPLRPFGRHALEVQADGGLAGEQLQRTHGFEQGQGALGQANEQQSVDLAPVDQGECGQSFAGEQTEQLGVEQAGGVPRVRRPGKRVGAATLTQGAGDQAVAVPGGREHQAVEFPVQAVADRNPAAQRGAGPISKQQQAGVDVAQDLHPLFHGEHDLFGVCGAEQAVHHPGQPGQVAHPVDQAERGFAPRLLVFGLHIVGGAGLARDADAEFGGDALDLLVHACVQVVDLRRRQIEEEVGRGQAVRVGGAGMAEQVGEADDAGERQSLGHFFDGVVMVTDGVGHQGGQVPLFAQPGAGLAVVDVQLLLLEEGEPAAVAAYALEQQRRVATREGHPQQQLADIVEQAGQVGLGRAGVAGGHRNLVGEQGAQVAVVPEPVDGEQPVGLDPAEHLLHRDADRQVAHRVDPQVDDRLLEVGEGPGRTHGGGVDQLQDLGADGRVLVDDAGDGLQADVRVMTAVNELHEHLRHARQAAGDPQGVQSIERCVHGSVAG